LNNHRPDGKRGLYTRIPASLIKIIAVMATLTIVCSIPAAAQAADMYKIQFNQPGYEVSENAQYAALNVELNKTFNVTGWWLQTYYNTRNGTADNATNFESPVNKSYPVSEDPIHSIFYFTGDISKQILVPIHNDGVFSWPDKYFFMNLTYHCPPHILIEYGAWRNVTITIKEADTPPVFQFEKTVYSIGENDHAVRVVITMTGTPLAADTSIPVSYSTADHTAIAGTNYATTSGSHTFTAGGDNSFAFDVPVINDGKYSPADLDFSVHLSSTAPVTLGADSTVQITEASQKPTVQFETASYSVDEDAGTATVYATLSGPTTGDVVAHYKTTDGTAIDGTNYTGTGELAGTITFPAGSTTSQPIRVPILKDNKYGGDTFFSVKLIGVGSGNADIGTQDTTKVTINENQVAFTLHLLEGWNLISFPMENESLKASIIPMNSGIDKISAYDASTQLYKNYLVGVSRPDRDIQFVPDLGYFFNCTENVDITFYGNPVDAPRTLTLYPSLNLIGWTPSASSTAKSFGNLAPDIKKISRYDSVSASYNTYIVGVSRDDRSFTMSVGNGYFVENGAAANIIVNLGAD
jgi:hypothetical protein